MNDFVTNKCPVCGGLLEPIPTSTLERQCNSCGLIVERRTNEAEHHYYEAVALYSNFEFEKAYDRLSYYLKTFSDDPEAYFLRALAYHKIKFEADTRGKGLTSFNNTPTFFGKMESIKNNDDYISALKIVKNNPAKLTYFQSQAEKIENIINGYTRIKQRAGKGQLPKYDIFICYKHTEVHGGLPLPGLTTQDYELAKQVYTDLLKKKYNVFLAAHSIPPGEEYEPYIYNALDTAKILLIISSRKEYIDSPWLKNERIRFKNSHSKDSHTFILYGDGFDPSTDLPMDLKNIQATHYNPSNYLVLVEQIDKILDETPSSTNVNYDLMRNLEIKKTRLLNMLVNPNKNYENYYVDLKKYATDITDFDSENRLAKFASAIADKYYNNFDTIKEFLKDDNINYDISNNYSKAIMTYLIIDGDNKITNEVRAYIRKVVSDKTMADKLIAEYENNVQKNREILQKSLQDNDIFIYCPSSPDIEEFLYDSLTYEKFSVWSERKNVPSGTLNIDPLVERAIKGCKVFVFVTSKTSNNYIVEIANCIKIAKRFNREIVEYKSDKIILDDSIKQLIGNYESVDNKQKLIATCRSKIDEQLYTKDEMEQRRQEDIQKYNANMEKLFETSEMITKLANDVLSSDANLNIRDSFSKMCLLLSFVQNSNFQEAQKTFINMIKNDDELVYNLTAMAYNLWSAFEEKDSSKRRLQILAGQNAYKEIAAKHLSITTRESEIISRIDSSDSIAILAISLRMLNDVNRYRFYKKYIHFDKLYSISVRNQLVKILSTETDFASLERRIANCPEIDYSVVVDNIFKIKGNEVQKTNILNSITSGIQLSDNIADILNEELSDASSYDYMEALVNFMYKNKLKINVAGIVNVPGLATVELTSKLLENMSDTKFNNWDIDTIIDYSINSGDAGIMHRVLSWLTKYGHLSEIGPHNIKKFTDVTFENFSDKLMVLKDIAGFNISVASMNFFISTYLENTSDSPPDRLSVINMLSDFCKQNDPQIMIMIKSYENYIITKTTDGMLKVEIIKKLREITAKFEKYDELMRKYIHSGYDSDEVKQQIISLFITEGNNINPEIATIYINMPITEYSDNYKKTLDFYLTNNPLSAMDQVTKYLNTQAYDDGEVATIIASHITTVTDYIFAGMFKSYNEEKLEKILPFIVRKIDNPKKCCLEIFWENNEIEINAVQCLLLYSKKVTPELKDSVEYLISKKCNINDKVKLIRLHKKVSFYDLIMNYSYNMSSEIKEFCKNYVK